MDIEQLTGIDPIKNTTDSIVKPILDLLIPLTIVSTILMLVFVAVYLVSAIRRYKVQQAVFDIQKTLHEINSKLPEVNQITTPINTPPNETTQVSAEEL